MKNRKIYIWLFCVVIFLIPILGNASLKEGRSIKFLENKNLEEVKTILKEKGKLGMLYFRSETCGWCDMLKVKQVNDMLFWKLNTRML